MGGIGVLINHIILSQYSFKVMDKQFDRILIIEMKNKFTDFVCILCVCYLSPENLQWGRDPVRFSIHVLAQIYLCTYADIIVLCGYINARVERENDCIPEIDSLPKRNVLDTKEILMENHLLNFLKIANSVLLDKMYKHTCDCFFKEMDKYLEIKNVNPKSHKLLKFSKPYWNDYLTVVWKNMCKHEKLFLKGL